MVTREPPLTRAELAEADRVLDRQPRTRAECPPADVPCPFVTCRYHLWTTRAYHRGAVVAIVESPVWGDMDHTCVLNDADAQERNCEQVGAILRIGRQRVHQVEHKALNKAREMFAKGIPDRTDTPRSWEASQTTGASWSAVSSSLPWADAVRAEIARRESTASTPAARGYVRSLRRMLDACDGLPPYVCPVCGTEAPPLNMKLRPRTACADTHCRGGKGKNQPTPSPLGPSCGGRAIGSRTQQRVLSVGGV